MQSRKTGRREFDPASGRRWEVLPTPEGEDYLAAGPRGSHLEQVPVRPPAGGDPPNGSFPLAAEWEVSERRACAWFVHQFSGCRGDSQLMRSLGDLADSEFALLLWDLSCYAGLCDRYERGMGPHPPPLHEYLQVDREHWGAMAGMLRELGWWGENDG